MLPDPEDNTGGHLPIKSPFALYDADGAHRNRIPPGAALKQNHNQTVGNQANLDLVH